MSEKSTEKHKNKIRYVKEIKSLMLKIINILTEIRLFSFQAFLQSDLKL